MTKCLAMILVDSDSTTTTTTTKIVDSLYIQGLKDLGISLLITYTLQEALEWMKLQKSIRVIILNKTPKNSSLPELLNVIENELPERPRVLFIGDMDNREQISNIKVLNSLFKPQELQKLIQEVITEIDINQIS